MIKPFHNFVSFTTPWHHRILTAVVLFLSLIGLSSYAAVPIPWLNADIGTPLAGSASYSSGIFTIQGSGNDIWGSMDNFHYVYQSFSGDVEIIAKVASLQNTNGWAKAGVMIRESLAGNSTHAFMATTPSNGYIFQYRKETRGSSLSTNGGELSESNWVRLTRIGNVFSGYHSTNGTDWVLAGTVTFTMNANVFIGLPVTSHNKASLCTATISDFTVRAIPKPKQNQTIDFITLANKLTNDAAYTVSATASSGLAVTYSIVSGPATISGNTVTLTRATGNVVVRASQAGDDNYNAAPHVEQSFTVTSASGLPSPWTNMDIGTPKAGNASYSNGTFTISGSGDDIWGISDNFHYVYQPFSGDVDVVAKVVSLQNTNEWAKAGVMIRESLAGNSKEVSMVISSNNGYSLQRRASIGGSTEGPNAKGFYAPAWLRIKRVGDVFTGYRSSNGRDWVTIGTTVCAMNSSVFIGLPVTAHNVDAICTAKFSNVAISVVKKEQTIAFSALTDKAANDAPFTVSATASSGLEVTYSIVSGPATISGNTITLTGDPGVVVVRASQAGNDTYNAAPYVDQSFTSGTLLTVTGLSADNATAFGADLHWNAISGANYKVRYKIQGDYNWIEVPEVITSANYTLNQGTPHGKYHWQVKALDQAYKDTSSFITLEAITVENGVYKAAPYNYPGLSASLKSQLNAISNQPYSPSQEEGFLKRISDEINYNISKFGVGNGGVYFEAEKASYPYAMCQMIDAIVKKDAAKEKSAKNFMQQEDNYANGRTLGVDLYPSFTLAGQMPKYFYFSKFYNTLDKSYEKKMRDALVVQTYDNLTFTRTYDNYSHTATGLPVDPLNREHPAYNGAQGWDPSARNSWVDNRTTDNLKAMREVAMYLFCEEIGNTTIANLYKKRVKDQIAALYHIGFSEWDSDPYFAYTVPTLLSLYAFTNDPEMKKVAKAGMDWYLTSGSAKYYRNTMAAPFKRVYDGSSSMAGMSSSATLIYSYFGGAPLLSERKHERHDFLKLIAGYRPPQAVYSLANKEIPDYTEQLNSHPVYGAFEPNAVNVPSSYETMFYGKTYRLGSYVSSGGDDDAAPMGLVLYNTDKGAMPFLAGTVYKGGDSREGNYVDVSKPAKDQIAQYRNKIIRLQPVSNGGYRFIIPKSNYMTSELNGGVWYFKYEKSWIAFQPINLKIDSTRTHTRTDYLEVLYTSPATGANYVGFTLEVVDDSQFESYNAFKAAVQPADLSQLGSGIVTLNGTDGEFLKMEYNTLNDLPKIYRNDLVARDFTDPFNYSVFRTVTPPTAAITNTSVNGANATITGVAQDLNRGVISQNWKDGTLRVIAGNSVFTSSMTIDGDVTYSEETLKPGVNDLGELQAIQLYANGVKVADASADQVASGNFIINLDNQANGDIVLKVRAIDKEGNVGWSAPTTITITNGVLKSGTIPLVYEEQKSQTVDLTTINLTINVSPNPIIGNFVNIAFTEYTPKEPVNVTIRDINGRMVYSCKKLLEGNNLVINTENRLANGIYILNVSTGTASVNKRIVVVK